MIQKTTMDTINSIKDSNNYYSARDIADSTMEYLRWDLNKKEPGYNYKPAVCVYGDFAAVAEGVDPNAAGGAGGVPNDAGQMGNEPVCNQILTSAGILNGDTANKDVKITLEIKGRNEIDEKFTGNCSNTFWNNGCYIVPLPGTGNAGERCNIYTPDFSGNASAKKMIDDKGQIIAQPGDAKVIPQIDYSCNWNKLTFGSSVTDRVVIPLYYQDGEDIINPYYNDPAAPQDESDAEKFVVRIRTPCMPNIQGGGEDETICSDDDRYELDTEENDIVVQWQISGTCVDAAGNEEQCGLIQNVNLKKPEQSSAITETRINNGDNNNGLGFLTKEVLYQLSNALDTNTENINFFPIEDKLSIMKRPILTLFLGDKLISTDGSNVPYLEYQVLTDYPVANSSTLAEVIINVEGIVFKKTLSKEEQKPLIDFAVQN